MTLKQLKQQLNENHQLILKELGMTIEVFNNNVYSTCPVHGGDNPRGFSYSPSKGIWRCWTRDCHQEHSNDILGLIQGVLSEEGSREVSFKDALLWACETLKCDVPMSNSKGTTTEPPEEVEISLENKINNALKRKIVNHVPKTIDIDCDVQIPSKYFIERGFKAETLKHFEVGDCGYCENNLRDRAIIPIHEDSGKSVVGIIARTLKEYRLPKFLFHPTGFDKRFYFYNYHRAIQHITNNNIPYLYITEGQGDVWRLYEAGVKNAVSIFGKTLSEQQLTKLKSMRVSSLIILTDDDQAGRESKVAISRQLSRTHNLIFPRIYNKDIGNMSIDQIKTDILSNLKGTY